MLMNEWRWELWKCSQPSQEKNYFFFPINFFKLIKICFFSIKNLVTVESTSGKLYIKFQET